MIIAKEHGGRPELAKVRQSLIICPVACAGALFF